MHRLPITLAALLVLTGAAPPAEAAIRECGGYDLARGFIPGDPDGAGVSNITTRVSTCRTARTVVRRYYVRGACGRRLSCQVGSFFCRGTRLGTESFDTRCTARGGRVVRFQFGA